MRSLSSYPLFERLRQAAPSRIDLFGMSHQSLRQAILPDSDGREEKVRAQWISGNAFDVLGVKPVLGRLLTPGDDERPGDHPVAVVSHAFWMRRFGGDLSVLGRWIQLEAREFQIVGVAQEAFTGVEPGLLTDLWVPNMMWNRESLSNPRWNWLRIWGRLRPGVDPKEARQILQASYTNFLRELARSFPPDEPRERVERYVSTPLYVPSGAAGASALRQDFQRPLLILAVVVGLVLLIACSNVANLLLARAAARERELMLRVSIGAGRLRLIQQVILESTLLAAAACTLGMLLAVLAAPAIVRMLAPSSSPAYLDLTMDWRVLAFVMVLAALTTLLFGLAPALRASTVRPMGALVAAGGRSSARIGVLRPLVAAQVAFSIMLLFIAGLLLLSFDRLTSIDIGFSKSGLLVLTVEERRPQEQRGPRIAGQELIDRVRQIPGVETASISGWALFKGWSSNGQVQIPGRGLQTSFLAVSGGFFRTMRIRMVDGREFSPQDVERETPSAVIVNEAFAQRYFPGERIIGKHVGRQISRGVVVRQEVIGLVGNAKDNDVRGAAIPFVYVPHRDADGALLVRTGGEPFSLVPALRAEIARVHPSLHVTDITLQSTLVDDTLLRERLLALLSGFFAVVGLLLAAVGLYGVLSYAVVQRTREIGIRLALGARPVAVVRSVLANITLVTLLGAAAGIAGGLFFSRFVRALLFEIAPLDTLSLALPVACLILVAVAAAFFPARRAARVDPIVALRHE